METSLNNRQTNLKTLYEKIKNNQHSIALVIGYVLVAALFFNLGRVVAPPPAPEVKIEEPAIDLNQLNITPNNSFLQSGDSSGAVAGSADQKCSGMIKGNISSSGKIYHLPGGAFYERTDPELCFGSEAEAVNAGFRKSQR